MAKNQIKLNHDGLGIVLKSNEVAATLRERVERMKAAAIEISPVGPDMGGHYKDRFKILESVTDRARVALINTSSYAASVEANHRVLGRVLDAGRD